MRISGPFYEGDSILRPGPTAGSAGSPVADQAPELLHRNTTAEVDRFALEQRARQLRSEYVARLFRRAGEVIDGWFERSRQRERDAYLAKSVDLADLERRIHSLERTGFVG